MRQLQKFFLFGLFSLVMAPAIQANEAHHHTSISGDETASEQQVVSARGVVKEVDLKNNKITIAHEAIPAIGWPAMTMRFTFTTPDDHIRALKAESPVTFSFIQQGNISLLQEINLSQP